MNRKIKFRVWRKFSKKFISSEYLAIGLDGTLIWHNICYNDDPYDTWDDSWNEELNDDEYEIQQWTGLLDKSGREIYEGDILLLTSNCYEDQTCQVKFGQGIFDGGIYKYAGFYLEKGGKVLEPYEITSLIDKSGLYECKIIGNIFETPDL